MIRAVVTFAAMLLTLSAQAQTLPNVPPPPGRTVPEAAPVAPAAAPRAAVTQVGPEGSPAAAPSLGADWLPAGNFELRVLDKVTARATSLSGRTGNTLTFGSLSIVLRTCLTRPADRPADSAAFLDITDRAGIASFHGWMIASAPALGMLEHPGYDVKVMACRP